MGRKEHTARIVDKASLPRSCLAIDLLSFQAFVSAGMCLATRCLEMNLHVTIEKRSFWHSIVQGEQTRDIVTWKVRIKAMVYA
jgi:hypothetical protein